ncbi:MAG: hypothetical protein ACK57B_07170 [Betaproteobacteria bacterium]
MSELSIDDVAARVVAWHNRNPLARRLRPADVGSVGHVALPFFDPDAPPPSGWEAPAGSLLARAMARARAGLPRPRGRGTAGALRAAFREDFIPPLRPDEVAALAARHGVERDDEPVDAPVRVVMPPPGTEALAWRWVLTAELRTDTARTRVLLGPAPGSPVLGRRLLSLPRVVALAALGGAALTLAVTLGGFEGGEPAPVAVLPRATPAQAPAAGPASAPAASRAAASAASATSPVTAPAERPMASEPPASAAPAPTPNPKPPPKPAPTPAQATAPAAPAAGASRPLDVEPRLGRIELPAIPSIVDPRRRRAAEQSAAAASAASAAAPVAAPAANAPAFALATRLLRTRTESEQIAEALAALLVVPGSPVQKVEVIKIGDDFRVVAWPYPSRADAERAQAALLARGHRLQLIDF